MAWPGRDEDRAPRYPSVRSRVRGGRLVSIRWRSMVILAVLAGIGSLFFLLAKPPVLTKAKGESRKAEG